MQGLPTPPLPPALSRRLFVFGAVSLGVLAGCGSPSGASTTTVAAAPGTSGAAETPGRATAAPENSGDSTAVGSTGRSGESFEISHTDDEWRGLLTPEQYDVLREAGTETPFSSPLNDEHAAGVFTCAGCALDLFSSTTKFDSGTGWPSFWQALKGAVIEKQDNSLGMTRTEVLCRRCGGHLGHLFDDGPAPTGLRYCMNGDALDFRSA